MPRGFVWAQYFDDRFRIWRLQVDADAAADGSRGWASAGLDDFLPFPRGWRARRVVGYDPQGNRHYAVIGRSDAPLWTGLATSWLVEGSDLVLYPVTVTGRQQERVF